MLQELPPGHQAPAPLPAGRRRGLAPVEPRGRGRTRSRGASRAPAEPVIVWSIPGGRVLASGTDRVCACRAALPRARLLPHLAEKLSSSTGSERLGARPARGGDTPRESPRARTSGMRVSMSSRHRAGQDRRVLAPHEQGRRGDALEQRPAVGGPARAVGLRDRSGRGSGRRARRCPPAPGARAARAPPPSRAGSSRKLASAVASVSWRRGPRWPAAVHRSSRSAGSDGRLSMMTSAESRSGCQAAKAIALCPPIEWPTTVIRSQPRASATPSRSPAKSSVSRTRRQVTSRSRRDRAGRARRRGSGRRRRAPPRRTSARGPSRRAGSRAPGRPGSPHSSALQREAVHRERPPPRRLAAEQEIVQLVTMAVIVASRRRISLGHATFRSYRVETSSSMALKIALSAEHRRPAGRLTAPALVLRDRSSGSRADLALTRTPPAISAPGLRRAAARRPGAPAPRLRPPASPRAETPPASQRIGGTVLDADRRTPLRGASVWAGPARGGDGRRRALRHRGPVGRAPRCIVKAPGLRDAPRSRRRASMSPSRSSRRAIKRRLPHLLRRRRAAASASRVLELVARTELNAVVIDVKGDRGLIPYRTEVPGRRSRPAPRARSSSRTSTALRPIRKARGIYTIARIVAFKDNVLANAPARSRHHRHPHRQALDRQREARLGRPVPRGGVGLHHRHRARKRSPRASTRSSSTTCASPPTASCPPPRYAQPNTSATRLPAIAGFLAKARRELGPTGAFLGADVFGYTAFNANDTDIGQRIEELAPHLDYICPMVYPSGYHLGIPGFRNPVLHPYEVVRESVRLIRQRAQHTAVQVRPWLQDFRTMRSTGASSACARSGRRSRGRRRRRHGLDALEPAQRLHGPGALAEDGAVPTR